MENELSIIASLEPAAEDWGRLYVSRKCIGAAGCRNFAPELLAEVAPEHGLLGDGVLHRAARRRCEDWERQCHSVSQLAAWAEAGRLRFLVARVGRHGSCRAHPDNI